MTVLQNHGHYCLFLLPSPPFSILSFPGSSPGSSRALMRAHRNHRIRGFCAGKVLEARFAQTPHFVSENRSGWQWSLPPCRASLPTSGPARRAPPWPLRTRDAEPAGALSGRSADTKLSFAFHQPVYSCDFSVCVCFSPSVRHATASPCVSSMTVAMTWLCAFQSRGQRVTVTEHLTRSPHLVTVRAGDCHPHLWSPRPEFCFLPRDMWQNSGRLWLRRCTGISSSSGWPSTKVLSLLGLRPLFSEMLSPS